MRVTGPPPQPPPRDSAPGDEVTPQLTINEGAWRVALRELNDVYTWGRFFTSPSPHVSASIESYQHVWPQ